MDTIQHYNTVNSLFISISAETVSVAILKVNCSENDKRTATVELKLCRKFANIDLQPPKPSGFITFSFWAR